MVKWGDVCTFSFVYSATVQEAYKKPKVQKMTGITPDYRVWLMSRLGNLGFFLFKLEILIVALSKSTYQSQRSRVQLPVGA